MLAEPFFFTDVGVFQVDPALDDRRLGRGVLLAFAAGLAACEQVLVHSSTAASWTSAAASRMGVDLTKRLRIVLAPRDERLVHDPADAALPDGDEVIGVCNHRLYAHYGTARFATLAKDLTERAAARLTVMDLFGTRSPERTGLTYGYGGLKLIRRSALREMGEAIDVLAALPGRVEFCQRAAGVTRFDRSPYLAWKAGFRESAMLARGSEYGMNDQDTGTRIDTWTASSNGGFAAHAAAGIRDGISFVREAAPAPARSELLNDPHWLPEHYARQQPPEAVAP